MPWRSEWVGKKINIAHQLAGGALGAGYGEAILILCSAISAMAADAWPGKGIDKKRFIETLVKYADNLLGVKKVSVPLLVEYYNRLSRKNDIIKLYDKINTINRALVLTGDDIDDTDSIVRAQCPNLTMNEVREFSYATILYTDIRSSYAHEYRPKERADSSAMTSTGGPIVSYVNRIDPVSLCTHRLIFFHIDWVASVASSIASALDDLHKSIPFPVPSIWWIEEKI